MIGDELAQIDVAMLFLNAGYLQAGAFKDISNEAVESMVAVNCVQVSHTFKVMLPHLLKREKRSAVVSVASIASLRPVPGLLTYSATKTFAHFMGKGANFELKDKVDVLSWQPGEIETKMLDSFVDHRAGKFGTISCETAVKHMFRQIGRESHTSAHWQHSLVNLMITSLPDSSAINKASFKKMTEKVNRSK